MTARVAEEWRPCLSHESYEVSSNGQVRNWRTGRLLGGVMAGSRRQYRSVMLGHRMRRNVHFLICESFNGPRPTSEHQAAHNNGNPSDNRAENLRWATRSENMQDAVRHGTISRAGGPKGMANPQSKLTDDLVREIRHLRATEGITCDQVAERYGIGRTTAKHIFNGRSWRHVLPVSGVES